MAALTEALEYLITNTCSKMGYLRMVHDTPERALQEVQAILRSNDIAQQTLARCAPFDQRHWSRRRIWKRWTTCMTSSTGSVRKWKTPCTMENGFKSASIPCR